MDQSRNSKGQAGLRLVNPFLYRGMFSSANSFDPYGDFGWKLFGPSMGESWNSTRQAILDLVSPFL